MSATTYLEQPINKVRVRPILTNASSQNLEILKMVEHKNDDMMGSNNSIVVAGNYQSTFSQAQNKKENLQLQTKLAVRLSKLMHAAREIGPLVVGVIALEAVITFSFSSIDGLFLTISTLAAGTSVYVSDGIKR